MENNNEAKYYTNSSGEKMEINSVETTHLINGLAKKMRDIFNSSNKDDYVTRMNEINDVKEEVYKRINEFSDSLKESDNNGRE